MPLQQYLTRAGDTADLIAFNYYGYTDGVTEALLAANPGLADYDVLPAGITVTLPAAPADPPGAVVELW
jgi:phage tail protein X